MGELKEFKLENEPHRNRQEKIDLKTWNAPKIRQMKIKEATREIIVHKKEVSPNWS